MPMMATTAFTPMRLTMGISGSGQMVAMFDPRYGINSQSSADITGWKDARGPLSSCVSLTGSAGICPKWDNAGQISISGSQAMWMTGSALLDVSKTMTIVAVGSLGHVQFSPFASIQDGADEIRFLGISADVSGHFIACFCTGSEAASNVSTNAQISPAFTNRVVFGSSAGGKSFIRVSNQASASTTDSAGGPGVNSLCIPGWYLPGVQQASSSIRAIIAFTHMPNVGEVTYITGYGVANFPVQLA